MNNPIQQVTRSGDGPYGSTVAELRADANTDKRAEQSGRLLQDLFPEFFAGACLLLFCAPLVKSADIAFDRLVMHWLGGLPRILVFLPLVFIAISYCLHCTRRRPNKWAVLLGIVGPGLVLGIQANRIAMLSLQLGDRLASSDCRTFPLKYDLEREWQAAATFRSSCPATAYAVQDCPGYSEEASQHPSWNFLWFLETKYECSGWCDVQNPLWQAGDASGDSCSRAVAIAMTSRIRHNANQIMVYCLFVVSLSVIVLVMLGPSLRTNGMDW
mmetsp:Transcript_14708/g.28499  ORF Transcript_14708/g.28499 Transcript_14708/m.28499 type:complete len:271 (-) Transcript_14708:25-837(-)